MTLILNRIIAIGGTTAHQHAKTVDQVLADYVSGADVLSCVVALSDGALVGWQSVGLWQGEPDIGTFVSPEGQVQGIGVAMFALTCDTLQKTGVRHIGAAIRSDNEAGLRYYARLGFAQVGGDPLFALETGQIVGRVYRRFDVV